MTGKRGSDHNVQTSLLRHNTLLNNHPMASKLSNMLLLLRFSGLRIFSSVVEKQEHMDQCSMDIFMRFAMIHGPLESIVTAVNPT